MAPDLKATYTTPQAARTALRLLGFWPSMPNAEGKVPWRRPGTTHGYVIVTSSTDARLYVIVQAPS